VSTRFLSLVGAIAAFLAWGTSPLAADSVELPAHLVSGTVDPGWDLFQTQAGTQFMGVPLTGVPLGTYNFGGSIGNQNVGNADTIVQRLNAASSVVIGSDTVSLQMNALQMVTAAPVTLGGGPLGLYYFTLQSTDNTGPASTGSMTITFDSPTSGTFTSSLDVFFDIHFGALNGPIVSQGDLTLTNSGDAWSDTAPATSQIINGVNYMLNGSDITNDFWPAAPLTETEAGVGTHVVAPAGATVPMPKSLWCGLALFAGMALIKFRRGAAVFA
jgi:hypothetical protein